MSRFILKLLFFVFILTLISGQIASAESKMYGFIKASINHSNNSLNSFNKVNMSAPTSASNDKQYPGDAGDRTTFQVAQTRVGGTMDINSDVSGLIEMDFIDFSKASPTTQTRPRLRRAFVNTKLTDKFNISIGQDWDMFSNFNPITFNLIGNYFNAGNVGFMRQQAKFMYHTDNQNIGFALGEAGNNSNTSDSELEEKSRLSFSALYERNISLWDISLSGITAKRNFGTKLENIWGSSLGVKYTTAKVRISSEGYFGEGLSKIGALSLPSNVFTHEYGMYLTGEYLLTKENSFYFGYGQAQIEDTSASTFDSVSSAFSTLGARRNSVWKTGYSFNKDKAKYYVESSYFSTQYQQSNKKENNQALNLEVGVQAYF